MADLTDLQAAQTVKIVGTDPPSGVETNWADVDTAGNLHTKDYSDGPVTPGVVAAVSQLAGGQFNTVLPAPTNTQQAALQTNQFGMLTIQFRNKYRNVKGNTTVLVKTGSGVLHGISMNNPPAGGTIIIYDNTSAVGPIIATINSGSGTSGVPTFVGPLGCEFTTGLFVWTVGSLSNDFTIYYY